MAMVFRPKPIPQKYRELFEKILSGSVRLDNICSVYRGIWTGVLHIFVVTATEINEYGIERDAIKPLLRGKDIFPFRYKWSDRWIIYSNGEEFKDKFPNAMKYLLKYKTILERRGAVWVYKRNWWELEEPLSPDLFETEKILSPYISRFNSFACEEGKYFTLDSTCIIRFWNNMDELTSYVIKWNEINRNTLQLNTFLENYDEIRKELKFNTDALIYLLGILNSEISEFMYKLYAPRLTKKGSRRPKGKYYLYIPPYVNVLPIKIGEKELRTEIIKKAREIMNEAIKLNNIPEDDEEYGEVKKTIEETLALKQAELNELVYEIYELSEVDKSLLQAYVIRKR